MISFLSEKAQKVNCKIALYNHGGWFGELRKSTRNHETFTASTTLALVYNFHHAHEAIRIHIEVLSNKYYPFLWCVTLNGMKKGWP